MEVDCYAQQILDQLQLSLCPFSIETENTRMFQHSIEENILGERLIL